MARAAGQVKVWDLPLRLFHWTLVVAVALAFLSSEEDSVLNQWHVLSGWVAGILIVFRLVWGVVGGEHSRFSDFIRPSRIAVHVSGLFRGRADATLGHNPLGAIAVLILLALIAVTVWTGAFGGEATKNLHEVIGWTLLAMVGLHVAAVIIMSLMERENLVRAMITGKKSAARHAGATDARPPSVVGVILAVLVLAGTVYAVLRYDPEAFTLRSTEAFEHRADSGTADFRGGEDREERD
jgi:cytochrome b